MESEDWDAWDETVDDLVEFVTGPMIRDPHEQDENHSLLSEDGTSAFSESTASYIAPVQTKPKQKWRRYTPFLKHRRKARAPVEKPTIRKFDNTKRTVATTRPTSQQKGVRWRDEKSESIIEPGRIQYVESERTGTAHHVESILRSLAGFPASAWSPEDDEYYDPCQREQDAELRLLLECGDHYAAQAAVIWLLLILSSPSQSG